MSASSDAWPAATPSAPERPVFMQLLEDASGPKRVPSRPLDGRYQVLEREPGSTPVRRWLAQQSRAGGLTRLVRVKQLTTDAPDFGAWQAALLDEAAALTAVDHPNVVALLDVVEGQDGLLLVKEHVDGPNLADVLKVTQGAGAGIPMDLAVYLGSELLWVVDAVHGASDARGRPLELVHRGVHPSQVWITRSGHVKLDGFELVRMRAGRRPATEPGLVKGFAAYLAPECIAGEPAGAAADVYAVGVMLFELLTGEPCFDGANAAEVLWNVVHRGPDIARLERHRVPPELRNIVAQATQPSPEDRYDSARTMARALDAYAELIRRHGRPWQVARYFDGQGLFPTPVGARMSEVATALVSNDYVPPAPVAVARVSSSFARQSSDEVTEVTPRPTLSAPAPSVETVSPVDVSDLELSEDGLEVIDDVDVVLIDLE